MSRLISALFIVIAFGLTVVAQPRAQMPPAPANDFRVVLLGTGTPNPRVDRFGPSILVEAGSERLVFDCGRSCTTRLWQLRIPLGTVKLFLTHLHSDHTVGIPDLWLTGALALQIPYGRRTAPFQVWGPAGTAAMMTNLQKAYEADIRIRGTEALNAAVEARDFTDGVVHQSNGVTITAFKVNHDDIDAYGFLIDYKDHSVLLSGDTRPSANLVAHAHGVDVVVHEVGMFAPTSEAGRQDRCAAALDAGAGGRGILENSAETRGVQPLLAVRHARTDDGRADRQNSYHLSRAVGGWGGSDGYLNRRFRRRPTNPLTPSCSSARRLESNQVARACPTASATGQRR